MEAWVINLQYRSDRWRLQRWQAGLHLLSLRQFPATSADQARQSHPHSPLGGGELGLLQSISRLLREVSSSHGWVVVLEDDALLKASFTRRMTSLVRAAPQSAWLIQAGYLTESSVRPGRSVVQNVRKVVRPRSRYRALRSARQDKPDGPFTRELVAGAQVLALNADHAELMRRAISYQLPWDKEIQRWATELPGRVFTASTSVAWQLPVRSDIRWRTAGSST